MSSFYLSRQTNKAYLRRCLPTRAVRRPVAGNEVQKELKLECHGLTRKGLQLDPEPAPTHGRHCHVCPVESISAVHPLHAPGRREDRGFADGSNGTVRQPDPDHGVLDFEELGICHQVGDEDGPANAAAFGLVRQGQRADSSGGEGCHHGRRKDTAK
jgi:hypothetical protein